MAIIAISIADGGN